MHLLIRSATIEDADNITRLSDQLGYTATPEQTKERLAEITASKDHCTFVATDNGTVTGWIHGFYTLRIESAPFVEIGGLVVDENYRRKGIGQILVREVTAWAKLKNAGTIRVRCNTVRKASHQFYNGIGFKEVKEQKIFSRPLM